MNRKQKRNLIKNARKNGMDKNLAEAFAEISNGTGEHTPAQEILEGEKVILNIEAIKARKHYDRMLPKYKEFVEKSAGNIYTAHIEKGVLLSLVEEPQWLFWSGDVIKVKDTEPEESSHE